MREHFGEQFTKECYKIFQTILKKLDMITEQQEDLLDCIHRTTIVNNTVWGGFVSQKLLAKERKRKKRKKNDGTE